MRQQRMLREELRDKKKELEDMMRKEHALKQNSRNQDTQSDVISYSNKSDLFGSVLYSLIASSVLLCDNLLLLQSLSSQVLFSRSSRSPLADVIISHPCIRC